MIFFSLTCYLFGAVDLLASVHKGLFDRNYIYIYIYIYTNIEILFLNTGFNFTSGISVNSLDFLL